MLNAQDSQFRLNDDGQVFYQKDASNPLPGVAVAFITKGAAPLAPVLEVLPGGLPEGVDAKDAKAHLAGWLTRHIATVLEALVALEKVEELSPPVRGICFQVHEAMGIIPREQVQDLIADLTPETRQELRAKNIRLGPVLVFMPVLNKPAAVRLRGLLWALWHDKPLPAGVPKDGLVSLRLEEGGYDRRFYQAIGYPVYGPRAIRIDMLDRVISLVYDSAKDGQFQAQHKMAEWLGCSIDDLYAVLAAMGHTKIEVAPAEAAPEADVAEAAVETDVAASPEAPVAAAESESATAEVETPAAEAKSDVKPDLAFFRLKKGKANDRLQRKKPFEKKDFSKKPQAKSGDGKPRSDRKSGKKPAKPTREPRIMQAGPSKPRPEDSPFAILEQLKAKK